MQILSEKTVSRSKERVRQRSRISGFTYLSVLAIVVIMGIMLGAAGQVWHIASKREKEQELLFVGDQFRNAIKSYYQHSPARGQRYPESLEDLLKDPRYPSTLRHLRKIYPDPVGGGAKWGLVKGTAGEILGVFSLSEEEPLKKSNFSLVDRNFEGQKKYRDWVFMYIPGK